MEEVKNVDTTVSLSGDADTEGELKQLICQVFPALKLDDIKLQKLAGGFTNTVFMAETNSRKVVIRIFSKVIDDLNMSNLLASSMRAAQLSGHGADVFACFNNGVVYGYQDGTILTTDRSTPDIRRKVVQKIAAFNQIGTKDMQSKGGSLPGNHIEHFLPFTDIIPEDWDGNSFYKGDVPSFSTKKALIHEVNFVMDESRDLGMVSAFQQGDMWWGNILYDSDKCEINFIDFDISGYYPFALDLSSFMARGLFDLNPPMSCTQLSTEEEKSLCRVYIEETRNIQNKQEVVTDRDVDILFALTRLCKPMVMIYIVLVTTLALHNSDAFDVRDIMVLFKKTYRKFKQDYVDFRGKNEHLFVKNWKP